MTNTKAIRYYRRVEESWPAAFDIQADFFVLGFLNKARLVSILLKDGDRTMNHTQNKVSLPVIKRLPKYYRYIRQMQANGVTKVSSSELARMMGTTASQVRQDFN